MDRLVYSFYPPGKHDGLGSSISVSITIFFAPSLQGKVSKQPNTTQRHFLRFPKISTTNSCDYFPRSLASDKKNLTTLHYRISLYLFHKSLTSSRASRDGSQGLIFPKFQTKSCAPRSKGFYIQIGRKGSYKLAKFISNLTLTLRLLKTM